MGVLPVVPAHPPAYLSWRVGVPGSAAPVQGDGVSQVAEGFVLHCIACSAENPESQVGSIIVVAVPISLMDILRLRKVKMRLGRCRAGA